MLRITRIALFSPEPARGWLPWAWLAPILLVLFNAVFTGLNGALGLTGDGRLGLGVGTVIVSHIAFSVPFVVLTVRARLHSFDKAVEEAAMDLGAEWVGRSLAGDGPFQIA